MRRLLTGYAMFFNRRYSRSGHLFQNRYYGWYSNRVRGDREKREQAAVSLPEVSSTSVPLGLDMRNNLLD